MCALCFVVVVSGAISVVDVDAALIGKKIRSAHKLVQMKVRAREGKQRIYNNRSVGEREGEREENK